jgi:hypothetical protein
MIQLNESAGRIGDVAYTLGLDPVRAVHWAWVTSQTPMQNACVNAS